MDETGPMRREDFLDSKALGALLQDPDSFDAAPVLAAAGYGPLDGLRVLSMGPGDALSDLLPDKARSGFMLDLDPPGWRSEWGGLLLFQDGGRVRGYRPVPAALTLFSATTRPLISLISRQGVRRTSILGWWT